MRIACAFSAPLSTPSSTAFASLMGSLAGLLSTPARQRPRMPRRVLRATPRRVSVNFGRRGSAVRCALLAFKWPAVATGPGTTLWSRHVFGRRPTASALWLVVPAAAPCLPLRQWRRPRTSMVGGTTLRLRRLRCPLLKALRTQSVLPSLGGTLVSARAGGPSFVTTTTLAPSSKSASLSAAEKISASRRLSSPSPTREGGGGVAPILASGLRDAKTGFEIRRGDGTLNRASPSQVIQTFDLGDDGAFPEDVLQELPDADNEAPEDVMDDPAAVGQDEPDHAEEAARLATPECVLHQLKLRAEQPGRDAAREAVAADLLAEEKKDRERCVQAFRVRGHSCQTCRQKWGWVVPGHRSAHHRPSGAPDVRPSEEPPDFVYRVLSDPPKPPPERRGLKELENPDAQFAQERAAFLGDTDRCLQSFQKTGQGCHLCEWAHGWVVAGHRTRHHCAEYNEGLDDVDWDAQSAPELDDEALVVAEDEAMRAVEWTEMARRSEAVWAAAIAGGTTSEAEASKGVLTGKSQWPATRTEGRGRDFDPAKAKELQKFRTNNAMSSAISEAAAAALGLVIVAMRWVLTWKEKPDPDKPGKSIRVPKARCVLMGHAGNDDRLTETYAGTPECAPLRILFVLAVLRRWSVAIADITNAFLQVPLAPDASASKVAARMCGDLPPEAAGWGFFPGSLHRLLHAVYGLKDAPRLFREWLDEKLKQLGWQEADECIYVKSKDKLPTTLRSDDQSITEVLGVRVDSATQAYVDDLVTLGATPAELVQFLRSLKVDVEDAELVGLKPRKVVGRSLSVKPGSWIREDQIDYAASIHIPEGSGRRKDSVNQRDFLPEEVEAVDLTLVSEYRQLLGALGWMATRTRWDLAFAFSALAQFTTTPTQAKLRTLKSVLRLAQAFPRQLCFVAVKTPELRLYVDAAWDEQKCRSRSGFLFQLADAAWTNETHNVLLWGTASEKRYVRSAPGAELLALVKGLLRAPALLRTARVLLGHGRGVQLNLRVRTDSATMLDQLRAKKVFKETALLGRLHWSLQSLSEMGATIEFVRTHEQLADPLTKWIPPAAAWPITPLAGPSS